MENTVPNTINFNAEDYINIAKTQEYNFEYSQAVFSYRKAILLYEKFKASDPQQYLKNVVELYSNIGHIMNEYLCNYTEAELNLLQSIKCCEELIAYGNASYSYGLASRTWGLGIVQDKLKKFIEAEQSYNKAANLYNQRISEYHYAFDYYDLATLLFQRGRLKRYSLKNEQEGMDDFKAACEKFEIIFPYMDDLGLPEEKKAEIFMEYAISKFELKQFITSIQHFKKSLEAFISAGREHPSIDRDIFSIYNYLCYLCKLSNKGEQAFDFAKRAYALAMTGSLHLKISDFMNTTIEVLQHNINGFTFGMAIDSDMNFSLGLSTLLDIDWNFISGISFPDFSGFSDISWLFDVATTD